MADVAYNTSSFPALLSTLTSLLALSGHDGDAAAAGAREPLVLLAYKERDPGERRLWDMMADVGLALEQVGSEIGAGGPPVEIWMGKKLDGRL